MPKLAKSLCEMGLTISVSEARRKIVEGAVRVNSQKIDDVSSELQLNAGDIVTICRRNHVIPGLTPQPKAVEV
jgi:ribosomal protein S4